MKTWLVHLISGTYNETKVTGIFKKNHLVALRRFLKTNVVLIPRIDLETVSLKDVVKSLDNFL